MTIKKYFRSYVNQKKSRFKFDHCSKVFGEIKQKKKVYFLVAKYLMAMGHCTQKRCLNTQKGVLKFFGQNSKKVIFFVKKHLFVYKNNYLNI